MTDYDKRHGSPYDRGSADAYYRRPHNPHYFVAGTYMSDKVETLGMGEDEIEAYTAGYNEQIESGEFKDY